MLAIKAGSLFLLFAAVARSSFASPLQNAAPGDTGTIQFRLKNDPASRGPLEGARLEVVSDPPNRFTVLATSFLGPEDIPANQTRTFEVVYQIDGRAPDGPISVWLRPRAATPDSALAESITKNDTQVQFSVFGVPPLVSWDLRRAPLPPRIKQFQGLDLSEQTTVADDAFVSVTALGGLADLRIQKDGETILHFAAATATGAPTTYGPFSVRDAFFSVPAKMPDGVYTFTAVDVFNRTTIGMLKHFAFELSVSSALSHAVYDEYAGNSSAAWPWRRGATAATG